MGTATLLTAGWHLPVCGRALGHIPGQRWGRGAQLPAGSQPGGRGPPMAPGGPPEGSQLRPQGTSPCPPGFPAASHTLHTQTLAFFCQCPNEPLD